MRWRGLVRYAGVSVIRNRQRALFALIAMVLAIAFISGGSLAIDSSLRSAQYGAIQRLEADFYGNQGASNSSFPVANITSALSSVQGVEQVEPRILLGSAQVSGSTNYSIDGSVIGVQPTFYQRLNHPYLVGNFSLVGDRAVISRALATALGVSPGERISLSEMSSRLTLIVEGILSMSPTASSLASRAQAYFVYIGMDPANALRETGFTASTQYLIWINHAAIIDPYDEGATDAKITQVFNDLTDAAVPLGLTISSAIQDVLRALRADLAQERSILLVVSLPLVVLGLYIAAIGNELGLQQRRRELAILKVRGAGPRQSLHLMLLEALFLGALGGTLGLLMGAVSSRFILPAAALPGVPAASYLDFGISPLTVFTAMGFGGLFVLTAGYRSAKRWSKLPPIVNLRIYSPDEFALRYRPTLDIVFICLAVFVYAFAANGRAMVNIAGTLFYLLGPLLLVLIPFGPFLLMVGLTRLLTLWTPRGLDLASRPLGFLRSPLGELVNRNLRRNPRRSSSLCLILALSLAFAVFVMAIYGTQAKYEERQLEANIGSDIMVEGYRGNVSQALASISAVEGVQAVSPTQVFDSNLYSIALDAKSYLSAVRVDDYFFVAGSPSGALQMLESKGNAIISRDYAQRTSLTLGDSVLLTHGGYSLHLRIVGIVKVLPGLGSVPAYSRDPFLSQVGDPTGSDVEPDIYIDYSNLYPSLGVAFPSIGRYPINFLVKSKEGYNPVDLAGHLATTIPSVERIEVYSQELADLRANPIRSIALNFLTAETGFTLMVLTLGTGFIFYAASLERDGEFASMVARGASISQARYVLLGEALSIILLGLAIGIPAGILSAAGFNQLVSFTGVSSELDRPLFIPPVSAMLVGFGCSSPVLAALLVSLRIRYTSLGRVLRMRGG